MFVTNKDSSQHRVDTSVRRNRVRIELRENKSLHEHQPRSSRDRVLQPRVQTLFVVTLIQAEEEVSVRRVHTVNRQRQAEQITAVPVLFGLGPRQFLHHEVR